MTTLYYVDASGNYIGGFDGAPPPAGAIQVPTPPQDARQKWSGTTWLAAPPLPVAPMVLNAATLAAALVAKGVLAQADINAAVTSNAGSPIAVVVATLP